jgi:DNA-K related protein/Hsp70 protein
MMAEHRMNEPVDAPVPPRFIAGIDLGTTNSALCFVDSDAPDLSIQTFSIPQVVAAGQVERFETLPSFHYEALQDERESGATRLPWSEGAPSFAVGAFARDHGRTIPGRMIESAKSWLCHNGVDRRAALLPWHGAADVSRLSPVEVSSRYLAHLRAAWNHRFPGHPLEHQDVVLTIPASFDEIARELTVAAARMAGLPRLALIEEPQAAFYSWVAAHRHNWEQIVAPGQMILVCDIGGGTSDFSLIHVRAGDDGQIRFHRIAVGEHLLLGGDNLDLALAHHVEQRLRDEQNGLQLTPRQWSQLVPACRHAKEILLGENAPGQHTLVISGGGSRLIGGAISIELMRDEVTELFLEGFLPVVELGSRPSRRQSGFQEFGLPYAADAAISRYLAAFLTIHGGGNGPVRPDVLLFNGGFFESSVLRERLVRTLERWFPAAAPWSPLILRNDRLDLAVAQGAASFGLVRRGTGVRIVAGLAQSYYIGVERTDGQAAAMCLVPAGIDSGSPALVLDQTFMVRTAEPVEFPIYVSGTRLNDNAGDVIDIDPEQLTALPPIRTVLTSRRRDDQREVSARLTASLTEIGTLELWCVQTDGSRRWQLQFDVRSATETDRSVHTGSAERSGIADQELIDAGAAVIQRVYSPGGTARPEEIMKLLSEAICLPRSEWPASLLRALWSELLERESGRHRSPQHEARWLNLAGYCLRPGFGMAADDWRVEETFRVTGGRLVHAIPACLAEFRTFCRRLSGGLTAGRQKQLAASILPAIRQRARQVQTGRGRAAPYASGSHEAAEIWRMLGSFELLDQAVRTELGDLAADWLQRAAFEQIRPALIWALGRFGSRVPLYGPLNLVLPADIVEKWIDALLAGDVARDSHIQLALAQLAQKTNDRYRDIREPARMRLLQFLKEKQISPHFIASVECGGTLMRDSATQVFGDALPAGLRLA